MSPIALAQERPVRQTLLSRQHAYRENHQDLLIKFRQERLHLFQKFRSGATHDSYPGGAQQHCSRTRGAHVCQAPQGMAVMGRHLSSLQHSPPRFQAHLHSFWRQNPSAGMHVHPPTVVAMRRWICTERPHRLTRLSAIDWAGLADELILVQVVHVEALQTAGESLNRVATYANMTALVWTNGDADRDTPAITLLRQRWQHTSLPTCW